MKVRQALWMLSLLCFAAGVVAGRMTVRPRDLRVQGADTIDFVEATRPGASRSVSIPLEELTAVCGAGCDYVPELMAMTIKRVYLDRHGHIDPKVKAKFPHHCQHGHVMSCSRFDGRGFYQDDATGMVVKYVGVVTWRGRFVRPKLEPQ